MTFYSKLIKAIYNPKLVLEVLFHRLKPYHAVVVTFKFKEAKIVKTPAIICRVTNDNINDALVYEPMIKVNTFRQFLEQGDWGYYAYIDDQWVHRIWVTFGPKTETQWYHFAVFKINHNDAFIKWGETSSEARGRSVFPAVLNQVAKDLKDKTKNIYTSTNADNKAAYRGMLKAGFVPIRETRVISFLGIKRERIRILSQHHF